MNTKQNTKAINTKIMTEAQFDVNVFFQHKEELNHNAEIVSKWLTNCNNEILNP